jgi:hypothetical protein
MDVKTGLLDESRSVIGAIFNMSVKRIVQPGEAFEGTAFKQWFAIAKF